MQREGVYEKEPEIFPGTVLRTMESAKDYYRWAMHDMSDPRTSNWLFVSDPFLTFGVTLLYLLVVWQGPKWMAKREAFDLKPLLVVYNFLLVILSAYMMYEFFAASIMQPRDKFDLLCQPVDYSNDPAALRLASACWWYFFSKIIEFLDTVFFVVRKKNQQISFLHVYHHATMVLLWWIGVRFVAGGESYFSAMVNCFIHVLMYTYYLLAAFGPRFQKYLWWKRYMTRLQLIQFVIILIRTSLGIYMDCGFPKSCGWALIAYMLSHILLFSNFYHKTYVKKPRDKKEQ